LENGKIAGLDGLVFVVVALSAAGLHTQPRLLTSCVDFRAGFGLRLQEPSDIPH
jgi:hypothetical protein